MSATAQITSLEDQERALTEITRELAETGDAADRVSQEIEENYRVLNAKWVALKEK